MLFLNPAQPGRAVRLATCMNMWPAEDPAGVQAGLEAVSLPLREALRDLVPGGEYGDGFGVGLWLPAAAAFALEADPFAASELREFMEQEQLDAFTFNAFPFGGFHEPGLKKRVFEPDWTEPERGFYTRAVAEFALSIAQAQKWRNAEVPRHLSISTHTGGHRGSIEDVPAFRAACARSLVAQASGLTRMGEEAGIPVRLGLEAEPRSLAGDTRELSELWQAIGQASAGTVGGASPFDQTHDLHGEMSAVLGACLDTCHAAVEFEHAGRALLRSVARDASQVVPRPLAKVQFSSALALANPSEDPVGVETLLALNEPVYLHQTTGRSADGSLLFAGDLSDLRELQEAGGEPWAQWLSCDEWRCHFHVPVDLAVTGGLGTTRSFADDLLARVLSAPETWGAQELHLEIETYTWALQKLHAMSGSAAQGGTDTKPAESRTSRTIAGIESEYRHVITQLASMGWTPA